MQFLADDDELSITLELDGEPADLIAEDLGEQLLEFAAQEMHAAAVNERSPSGEAWDALAAATVRRKGHGLIGMQTGAMVGDLLNGQTVVGERSATWSYPRGETYARTHGFHNGGNGRPARRIVGWTAEAKENARLALRFAGHTLLADDD